MPNDRSASPVQQPRCRFCGRPWTPPSGVLASQAYCSSCSSDRRALAAEHFGARPLQASDICGDHVLPAKRSRP